MTSSLEFVFTAARGPGADGVAVGEVQLVGMTGAPSRWRRRTRSGSRWRARVRSRPSTATARRVVRRRLRRQRKSTLVLTLRRPPSSAATALHAEGRAEARRRLVVGHLDRRRRHADGVRRGGGYAARPEAPFGGFYLIAPPPAPAPPSPPLSPPPSPPSPPAPPTRRGARRRQVRLRLHGRPQRRAGRGREHGGARRFRSRSEAVRRRGRRGRRRVGDQPGGTSNMNEEADNLVDGKTWTKWVDVDIGAEGRRKRRTACARSSCSSSRRRRASRLRALHCQGTSSSTSVLDLRPSSAASARSRRSPSGASTRRAARGVVRHHLRRQPPSPPSPPPLSSPPPPPSLRRRRRRTRRANAAAPAAVAAADAGRDPGRVRLHAGARQERGRPPALGGCALRRRRAAPRRVDAANGGTQRSLQNAGKAIDGNVDTKCTTTASYPTATPSCCSPSPYSRLAPRIPNERRAEARPDRLDGVGRRPTGERVPLRMVSGDRVDGVIVHVPWSAR